MTFVLVNHCYGGFSLSKEAYEWLGLKWDGFGFLTCYKDEEEIKKSEETMKEWPNLYRDYEGSNTKEEMEKALGVTLVDEYTYRDDPVYRTSPRLIECVETLKEKANGALAKLEIIEIPDSVDFIIEEYDGIESIHEVHRSW